MSRAVSRGADVVVPRRLGTGFRWLLASSWTTNLGDGIAIAAGPLLVASQTDQPFLVALAALMVWAPPLLFGLYAGALTDRLDRRRIVITVDLVRAGVLALLTAFIVTGSVSIALVLVAMFLLGTAEMFADNASQTLLPMIVDREDLAVANSRLQTGFITVNQLAGPPVGAALFAAGAAWPFATQAVLVLLGTVLVSRLVLPRADTSEEPAPVTRVRQDIAEGFGWVRGNAAVRTLVLTIFTFNITFGAAWSVLVLYATERLGLGEIGFGLVTTVGAVGGLLGVASYGWITRHVSLGDLMRIGLVVETLTHLGLALTRSAYVALPIFLVFGAHAFIWGTTSITVRQRAVPSALQGRVGSVNLVGVFGGLVIGSGIGGLLAQHGGLTAPFWFAFVGSAVFVVLIWGQLSHIAHADEAEAPAAV
ncbi:MFS transporter [Nocardioides sp.]|uniref:MFS transporter n=1 Tax=Nocardioides sp. TaxID=35761 RepID=UPI00321AE65F